MHKYMHFKLTSNKENTTHISCMRHGQLMNYCRQQFFFLLRCCCCSVWLIFTFDALETVVCAIFYCYILGYSCCCCWYFSYKPCSHVAKAVKAPLKFLTHFTVCKSFSLWILIRRVSIKFDYEW